MREFPDTSLQVTHIDEPELQFGHGQVLDHPKDGLFLYGPHQLPKRRTISVGLIATKRGEKLFRNWLGLVLKRVKIPKPSKREKIFRPHLSDFPGLEETYGISVDPDDLTVYRLQQTEIEDLTALENHHEAVSRTVDLFLTPIEDHLLDEEKTIDVWVFAVPELVFERCRPLASGRRNVELTPGEFPMNKPANTTSTTKPDPKVIQEAIKKGQELIKQEKTKAEASMAMYRLLHEGGCDQETIVDAFVKGANLTPMGARTYFYNCRRKYKK